MKLANAIFVAAAILGMALVISAAAVTVNYTVGGTGPMQFPAATTPPEGSPWGPNGYPGDTVEFLGHSGSFDLAPGTYVLKINTVLWTIDYTYGGTETCWDWPDCWSELSFPLNAPRSITVHTSNGALAQTGLLECNYDDDYLGFNAGSTVTFNISGTTVYVTPLAVPRTGAFSGWPPILPSSPEQAPMCNIPCQLTAVDVYARFVVEGTVPVESTTWGCVKALFE